MKNLKFKAIGTNRITKTLEDEVFESPHFAFSAKNLCFVDLKNNGKDYTFELKLIRFLNESVILDGFISMPDAKIGRISLKYLS